MRLNRDFKDLFSILNAAQAEYLIVGDYALAVHGAPRFTKDLDVWVGANTANAKKVWLALVEFGAPGKELRVEDLSEPGVVFQIGLPPNRIDIITSIDGVVFAHAFEHRLTVSYGGESVTVIGLSDLISNKLASGRPQDLLDVQMLRALTRKQ